jgi:hypothetical protein
LDEVTAVADVLEHGGKYIYLFRVWLDYLQRVGQLCDIKNVMYGLK